MTHAEKMMVILIKGVTGHIRNYNEFVTPSGRAMAANHAANELIEALAFSNCLPAHLKAKHRGPIMSRLNKVRALARRAAA